MNFVGKAYLSIDRCNRRKSKNTLKHHAVSEHTASAFIRTPPVKLMADRHSSVVSSRCPQFVNAVIGNTHDTGSATRSEKTPLILKLVPKKIIMKLDREDFKPSAIMHVEMLRVLLYKLTVNTSAALVFRHGKSILYTKG